MKAKAVPALRCKRGLRPVREGEPQVVGLTPQTAVKRKADTMKTYILRTQEPVEPQRAAAPPRRSPPPPQPTPAAPPAAAPALCLGLDVHQDSIAVSLAPPGSTEVRRYGVIGGTLDDALRLAKKLQAAHPGETLRFCYEAGPTGFTLDRFLRAHGYECLVVAPSKIPRCPGDRVKTDRRDADQLARLLRAGELTALHVPDPQDEAVRDLLRARDQVRVQRHRARQQLKMYLLRHNRRSAGTTAWSAAHRRYLATIKMPFAEQQFVFQEMIHIITEADQRMERYEKQLPSVVAGWRWEPVVKALMSLRGLALLNASILVAELGDLHRFATAGQLMSYLGLVPSEDTTGGDRRQGGLTKMGNGFARRALIESAWHYRMPARISPHLQKRQEDLPQEVTAAAWNAQTRLHARYKHLVGVGRKKSTVAAAALGRELAGFVWAIGRMVAPRPAPGTPPPL